MIFDKKQSGQLKARLVIGGHVVDASGHDVYASTMKTISARALMLIASANKMPVLTGDIGNAYLYARTNLQVYCRLGSEFNIYDKDIPIGAIASVEKAWYGLPTSANRWSAHLANTLLSMGFKPTRFDSDIWIRPNGRDSYDYIGAHTDDLMCVSYRAQEIIDTIKKTYTIKEIKPPSFHLGCDYRAEEDGSWSVGTKTYVSEALKKVKEILGRLDRPDGSATLGLAGVPMAESYKPEVDDSERLDLEAHRKYQQLIGIAQWLITCGRFDLSFAVTSLSRFSAAPRAGHMKAVITMFQYLNGNQSKWINFNSKTHIPPKELENPLKGMNDQTLDWSRMYPDAEEELDKNFPSPRGVPLDSAVYFDSNWAHDEITRRSISGVISFIGNTPVSWISRRQGAIATSTYSAELCAAKVGAEEVISLRYMLRSLGVPVDGPTLLIGDNLGSLMSVTATGSPCKKKHSEIAYHYVRECNAASIVKIRKIHTDWNYSDLLTKALGKNKFWLLVNKLFYNSAKGD